MRRFLAIGGIGSFCTGIRISFSSKDAPPTTISPEKAYLQAAYSFLLNDLKRTQEIAQTINRIKSGYVTLSEIRNIIDTAI